MTIVHSASLLGAFVLNIFVAIIGTSAVEGPVRSLASSLFPTHARGVLLLRDCIFTVLTAALLSWLMQKQWRVGAAQWVWVACTLWFLYGAIHYLRTLAYGIPFAHEIWHHFSGTGCVVNGSRHSCDDLFI